MIQIIELNNFLWVVWSKSSLSVCTLQVECGSFGLLILTFFLSFLFLYFWSEAQNDYIDFDWWVSHSWYCAYTLAKTHVFLLSFVGHLLSL